MKGDEAGSFLTCIYTYTDISWKRSYCTDRPRRIDCTHLSLSFLSPACNCISDRPPSPPAGRSVQFPTLFGGPISPQRPCILHSSWGSPPHCTVEQNTRRSFVGRPTDREKEPPKPILFSRASPAKTLPLPPTFLRPCMPATANHSA